MTRQFDVFARLVATRSIAECAQALAIAPAAVLEAMSGLEDLIGCQIFAIEGGAVELTPSGRKIVGALNEMTLDGHVQWAGELAEPAAEAVSPALVQVPRELEVETVAFEPVEEEAPVTPKHFRPYRREEEEPLLLTEPAPPEEDIATPAAAVSPSPARDAVQVITLASNPAIFSHFQEALLAFEEASPDIGIDLMLENIDEDQAARLFLQEKADIAYYYALAEGHHFPSRYAWSERISLFVRADHPLADEEALGAREIAALPYAALERRNLSRTLTEGALAASGLDMPEAELETDDLYRIMNHLKQSDACFAAFGSMARDFGRMAGIGRLAYASGLPQIQVRQAIRPALANDPAIMALAEFLFR